MEQKKIMNCMEAEMAAADEDKRKDQENQE
jgi:hypothetical protein